METELKLDYTLKTPEERMNLVEQLIQQTPPTKMTDRLLET